MIRRKEREFCWRLLYEPLVLTLSGLAYLKLTLRYSYPRIEVDTASVKDSQADIVMTVESPFPTSISSLLLPSASQSFFSTLSSLNRSTLCTTNRLHSIHHDSLFVQNVAAKYNLPLVANERCGSWYIPQDQKAGSAYFKSTDGHWGQWSFSTRRLNVQILDIIGKHGGFVMIIRSKSY